MREMSGDAKIRVHCCFIMHRHTQHCSRAQVLSSMPSQILQTQPGFCNCTDALAGHPRYCKLMQVSATTAAQMPWQARHTLSSSCHCYNQTSAQVLPSRPAIVQDAAAACPPGGGVPACRAQSPELPTAAASEAGAVPTSLCCWLAPAPLLPCTAQPPLSHQSSPASQ